MSVVPAIAYLGPEGTFTHQAARDLAGEGEDLRALPTVPEVVQAVESGAAAGGVIALENSLEGPIPANLDELLLRTSACMVAAERVLPVSFDVFRAPGDDARLTGVASHPFGLAQCSRWVAERGLDTREATSTAEACRDLAETRRPGWGALAPALAGELYGLAPEAQDVGDDEGAATRFVLLRAASPAATGQDRSAFGVRPAKDEPGSLVRMLQQFSLRGINLTAIKSRPTRALLGEYVFYIECEGHVTDPNLRDAALGLLRDPGEVRFLGSFPEDSRRPPRPAAAGAADAEAEYAAMLARVAP